MNQPTVVRVLFWGAALFAVGGVCCVRSASAESRALLPIIEADPEHDGLPAENESDGDADADDTHARGASDGDAAAARKHARHRHRSAKRRRSRRGAWGRQPSAEYRRIRDSWHAPVPAEEVEPVGDDALRPLVLVPINAHGGERVSLIPQREDGGFTEEQLAEASRAFTPPGRRRPHPIAPRLLDLVYRAVRHFDVPLVHLISGYRADRAGSRHTQGRAIDMVLPGVTNEELAAYVRQFGFVGVGVYPKSGFVHLDVRESSYFWLDYSLPNERCRPQPTLMGEAKHVDQQARDRGEEPNTFVPGNEREDRAAARAYRRRAKRRRLAAQQARNF